MNYHKVFLISISIITTLQIYQKSCLYIRSDFYSSNSKVTGQPRSWNNNENCYRAILSRECDSRKIRKKEEEKQEREREEWDERHRRDDRLFRGKAKWSTKLGYETRRSYFLAWRVPLWPAKTGKKTSPLRSSAPLTILWIVRALPSSYSTRSLDLSSASLILYNIQSTTCETIFPRREQWPRHDWSIDQTDFSEFEKIWKVVKWNEYISSTQKWKKGGIVLRRKSMENTRYLRSRETFHLCRSISISLKCLSKTFFAIRFVKFSLNKILITLRL